jgi:hypothetical protein
MSEIRMGILVPVEDLGKHVVGLELFNVKLIVYIVFYFWNFVYFTDQIAF